MLPWKQINFPLFLGLVFILVGLGCNVWSLAPLINPSGEIQSVPKKVVIWLVDIFFILWGSILIRRRNHPDIRKNFLFPAMTIALVIVFLEMCIRILCLISPPINYVLNESPEHETKLWIRDPVLLYKPNPDIPDHDKNGWRNSFVPRQADVVALGDSQTYGVGVAREYNWPSRLAQKEIGIYNISFGGYGPTEYLLLLDEAMELQPKIVLVAVYTGNDFYDCYEQVYLQGQLPDLKTNDETTLRKIQQAEQSGSIEKQFFSMMPRISQSNSPVSKILGHVKIYRLFQAIETVYYQKVPLTWNQIRRRADSMDSLMVFSEGTLQTVFAPGYHLLALNMTDVRIVEGFSISQKALQEIHDRLQHKGISFFIVLIPSKELAFSDLVSRSEISCSPLYSLQIEYEKQFYESLQQYLASQQIECIDTLPPLRGNIEQGNQLYPKTWDGHLNALGQKIVAETVWEKIAPFFLIESN